MITNQQVLIVNLDDLIAAHFRTGFLAKNAKVDAVKSVSAARKLIALKHIDVAFIGREIEEHKMMTRLLDEQGIPYFIIPGERRH